MGPLAGVKVIEIAGIGPAPFCAMLLADMGAEILRIERLGGTDPLGQSYDILARGRARIALDLKHPEAVATILKLLEGADALIEGFRPGVMERLGLGPQSCLERNPRLIYGRMTGWGQDGPLAPTAGHDINYLALSGALHAIGPTDGAPLPPLNLVADFGGGGMLLAFGLVCALLEARQSGQGQVVDAAMTDGAALLMAMMYSLKANGWWKDRRGDNFFDGALPIYRCYECADGQWLAIGPLEPQFHALMLQKLGIDDPIFANPADRRHWPAMLATLTKVFAGKPRQEWLAIFQDSDACVTPVLSMTEAPDHPHNRARGTFIEKDGVIQPAPAPRFSRTPAALGLAPQPPGQNDAGTLTAWGFQPEEIQRLRSLGALS